MSSRRKLIYATLFALTLLFNYGWLRVRPACAQAQKDSERQGALREQRSELQAQADLRALAALERELTVLERELASERARLDEHARSLASPMQSGELAVQVAALAEEVGLRFEVEEALEHPRVSRDLPERPTAANLERFLQAEPLERPLRTWTLRGDFAGLWSFVSRLRTLPWRVVVLRLEVEQRQHLERYEPPLLVTLTVAQ